MGSGKARLGPEFTKLSKRPQALPSDFLSTCLNPINSNQRLATFYWKKFNAKLFS